jgi:hypothetical protein
MRAGAVVLAISLVSSRVSHPTCRAKPIAVPEPIAVKPIAAKPITVEPIAAEEDAAPVWGAGRA